MKNFSSLMISGALVLLSTVSNAVAADKEPKKDKRPNVIFIFSDDHAYQAISAYGSKLAHTPNIDRIADEGAVFKNLLVTNSICGPSRATLLTGKYSHKNGYKVNEIKFDSEQTVFSRNLQQAGYETAWVGKWHLGTLPGNTFDYWNILPGQGHYYNPDFINAAHDTIRYEGYVTDIITDFAKEFIANRDDGKPFFLVVGEKATHRQWLPDIQDLGAYDEITFPLPETFYDNYQGRFAAAEQDMTISETLRLKEDLKVGFDFDPDEAAIALRKKELAEQHFGGAQLTPDQDKMLERYLESRYTPEQKKALAAYYDKITREYEGKKLSGKELVEWKYQRYLREYLSTAASLDRNIGKLLDYLDETGLADNTIVIYGSDQGFYLGEHGWFDKRFIYEESLRTPFVPRYPGVVKPGTEVTELVLNIDWAPTFLDIAEAPIPEDIQGESFLPLLVNEQPVQWRDVAYYHYYEFPQPHHVHPHFGIRTERYKLIRFYGEQDSWELFDLEKDPHELDNVYSSPEYADTKKALITQLRIQIDKYEDKDAAQILNRNEENTSAYSIKGGW